MTGKSVGRQAAKVLGINVDYRKEEPIRSSGASISSVETCEYLPMRDSINADADDDALQMLRRSPALWNTCLSSNLRCLLFDDT